MDVYVVADALGYVGAFTTRQCAEDLLAVYLQTPMIVSVWRVAENTEHLYVLPYRGSDAVAYVTGDHDSAVAMQRQLVRVGLVYPDSVDYWRHPVGEVCPEGRRRLEWAAENVSPPTVETVLDQLRFLEGPRLSYETDDAYLAPPVPTSVPTSVQTTEESVKEKP